MKRLIKSGAIVRNRPKGGRVTINIPRIDIPHFLFGDSDKGVGRGPGKEGDIIGRNPRKGKDKGEAGDSTEDGIRISLDMEEVLRFLSQELQLPEMKPKPSQTFDEIRLKYNDISKTGPESLRHTGRTMKEALKRLALQGELDNPQMTLGSKVPIKLITPINSDRRYRQYKELKIPSSNAVIFFARDCSGSMDDYKCDIINDMSWWIDCWIRRFYEKVERRYVIHDSHAEEVDQDTFYSKREMGGTKCSTAFQVMSEMIEHQFPPHMYNIYVFYFTDGDNWGEDNNLLIQLLRDNFGNDVVNLLGVSEICASSYNNETVKNIIDKNFPMNLSNPIKTIALGDSSDTEEERNAEILESIKLLLQPKNALS